MKSNNTTNKSEKEEKLLRKVITKEQARELGLVRYFTGNRCSNGHFAERLVSTGACVDCQKARLQNFRQREPRNYRAENLKSRYGITEEQYEEQLKRQMGRCAVCDEEKPNLVVDHSHQTKQIRGLLCHNCNLALGHTGESLGKLVAMANYLIYGFQSHHHKI